MSEFIYPDLTNSQFDTPYGRRLALPGDLGPAVGVIHGHSTSTEDPDPPPVTGQRFAVVNEDDLATQEREFDLTGAFNFAIVNGANPLFQIIGSSGQLVFGQYGEGTFEDEPTFILGVDAGGNLIEINPDDLGGGGSGADMFRFGVSGEDDTAGENRSFDMTGGAYSFAYTGDSDNTGPLMTIGGGTRGLFSEGSTVGLYGESLNIPLWGVNTTSAGTADVQTVLALGRQNGAGVTNMGVRTLTNMSNSAASAQATSSLETIWMNPTAGSELAAFGIRVINGATLNYKWLVTGTGQVIQPDYGAGTFDGTPTRLAGWDGSGNLIEIDPSDIGGGGGGSGVDSMRFGYSGEDDTAGENRIFDLSTLYSLRLIGNYDTAVQDSLFKVTNSADGGLAIYGKGIGTAYGIRGESDSGYAGLFSSTDGVGVSITSVNGLGALIASTNGMGAQISSDGTYSTKMQTSSENNNSVLPNVLIAALTLTTPAEDGFGQSLDFQTNTLNPGTNRISNQIISRWTIADDATGQSELLITGVAVGALQDLISVEGTGLIKLLQSLPDYANDAAAAAGTPVIPITGLYRNGSQMMIRVA